MQQQNNTEYIQKADQLYEQIASADAIVIGAGAGLSAAAGHTYSGERFERNFPDVIKKYGIRDMYSATFYPYDSLEEYWAYMSRHIYLNRFQPDDNDVYMKLFELVRNKDYFVITTNVDHCFQKAGFDKERLFYTQGDYGLWQCSKPCHHETYDNEDIILRMVEEQRAIHIPSRLIPHCPKCGKPMSMNLRCDHTFVQDKGWHQAFKRYAKYQKEHKKGHVLYLELGVGGNTPVIIKYPFWEMTHNNPKAVYACLNRGEAYAATEIEDRSICIDMDIKGIIDDLHGKSQ